MQKPSKFTRGRKYFFSVIKQAVELVDKSWSWCFGKHIHKYTFVITQIKKIKSKDKDIRM